MSNSKFIPQGMGWIPDLPDPRDYTYRHKEILPLLQHLRPSSDELPDETDLRYGDEGEVFFTDAENQGPINSSTAFAVLGLVEYFERRVHGRTFDGSKLFLYKVTRHLRNKQAQITGDTGADLRTTLKALCRFGVVGEEHWPYSPTRFDEEPSSFIYQAARPIETLRYFRIDDANDLASGDLRKQRCTLLMSFLAAGFPIAFGFSVPSSLSTASDILHRSALDEIRGGQAALAIGYKLDRYGRNQHALLIRTSWGKEWGDNGNGWIPFQLVRQSMIRDPWTLIDATWTKSPELSRPRLTATD